MAKAYIFLADGFEEIEAITPVDLMRRAGITVTTVSITPLKEVTGANGVTVVADTLITDIDPTDADLLVCPGGMPGAANLAACTELSEMLRKQHSTGRYVAAICAAPAVTLAPLGILSGKKATCYPGLEKTLAQAGATHISERVVRDGNVITSNGPSSAIPFSIALIEALCGSAAAGNVASGILL